MKPGKRGVVAEWFDEKGYGFIEPVAGGRRIFFHISSVRNSFRRDLAGQRVSYREGTGKEGRPAAEDVYLAVEEQTPIEPFRHRRARRRFGVSAMLAWTMALAFFACLGWAVWFGYMPIFVLPLYAGMSLITFIVYITDKLKAGTGEWRTPESTLHGLELAGGWPGALAAQWHIGHKNRKSSYQFAFWLIVLINVAALGWFSQQWSPTPAPGDREIIVEVY